MLGVQTIAMDAAALKLGKRLSCDWTVSVNTTRNTTRGQRELNVAVYVRVSTVDQEPDNQLLEIMPFKAETPLTRLTEDGFSLWFEGESDQDRQREIADVLADTVQERK